MTEHAHIHDLVDDYVHALLEPEQARRVVQHCQTCEACQASLDEARRRAAALQAVPPVEAPPELVQTTLDAVDEHEERRRRRHQRFFLAGLVALAACLLVLIGLQVHYGRLKATPFDLVVLGQRNLLAMTNNSLRLRLFDRETREPLAGVPVDVDLVRDGKATHLVSFTTDDHGGGQPRFQTPDWPDGEYELRVTAKTGDKPEVLTRTIELERSWQVMLTSDKPIYQPGQTIHVRSLTLRRPDLKPVAKQQAVFTLTDPKGNVLFKQAGETSKFGITSVDCELAREIVEGPYTLACRVGDTESQLAVTVEKYVLPKFKIELTTDRPYYQPGDKATVKVKSAYFFGKPVVDAKIELAIRTNGFTGDKVADQTLQTDKQGNAEFEFAIPNDLQSRETNLSIKAKLTDSAGQTQSLAIVRLVTEKPVRVEMIAEGGKLVRDVENKVYLVVTRADGSPVQAHVAVSGVMKELQTNALGVASFEVTPEEHTASFTVRVTDEDGNVLARHVQGFVCGTYQDDFLFRTDKAVYRSGESMNLTVLGGGKEPVFVDFVREGKERQLVLSETIDLKDGEGSRTLDLPPDLFGTLRIYGYRFGMDGLMMQKTRVVYVHPPGGLQIKTVVDRDEYRPGETAKLRFTLTDADGKPAPGALSLSAVDEAVFAVLKQRPGMERLYYTLQAELLKPVYTIYPWSPDFAEKKSREREDLESALFAATAEESAVPMRQQSTGSSMPECSIIEPFSLSASTFPNKVRMLNRMRKSAKKWIVQGYIVLGMVAAFGLYLMLWVSFPVADVLKMHGIACIVLAPLCLMVLLGLYTKMGSSVGESDSAMMLAQTETKSEGAEGGQLDVTVWDRTGSMLPIPDLALGHIRVREYFPETLAWKPQLITDEQGRASFDLALADSITTWRVSLSAVTGQGHLGAAQFPVKVFQPFFVDIDLPVFLTRNDESAIPVVVYNYLDADQAVTLKLAKQDWFDLLEGDVEQKLDLKAGEVRSFHYRIKVKKVGKHRLRVDALGMDSADALVRKIDVEPDGRRIELVKNGTLTTPAEMELAVPENAIEGSVKAFVKLYPSNFSQVVEGLDNIFRMPHGCFEQTSSTTYPNALALTYLKRTNQSLPQVEAKARQYLHLGYQRLLSFEIIGGGFDWFGKPPANRTLTAYGLMEFVDMAKVHNVDPKLIYRTRQWLLAQRETDGSWKPDGGLHDDPTQGTNADHRRLATTAYIAWAVFEGAPNAPVMATKDYLLAHSASSIHDPHLLAQMANAILALDPSGKDAEAYLDRLVGLKRIEADGKHAYWEKASGETTFHARGETANIETTALATLALLKAKRHAATVRSALTWLITKKDAQGTWHSTQATVLSLKALLTATESSLGDDKPRRFAIRVGDKIVEQRTVEPDQAEVLQMIEITDHLITGTQQVSVIEKSNSGSAYQVAFRYHVPGSDATAETEPLRIRIDYDRTELKVNETVYATVSVFNQTKTVAPMVMLDLPVPGGFAPMREDFAKMVTDGDIARFQVTARQVIVYLRALPANGRLKLEYRLQATLPVKVTVPGARVYEYYTPDREARSEGTKLVVVE